MKKKVSSSYLLRFDRTLSQDTFRQILILVGALVVAFFLSFILLFLLGGNWQDYCIEKKISKWIFPFYLLIDGNAFSDFYSNGKESSGAIFTACLIYIAGVVIFTGMLIAVISNIVERRVEDYKAGHIYYLKSGHYIIMGYDEMVPSFIHHIFSKDKMAKILILSSKNATSIKEELSRYFNKELMKRIVANYGDRTSVEIFKDIHLESAEQIFIVGKHSNSVHDAINVECVDCIHSYLSNKSIKEYPKRITCTFKDLDTYAAFKTSEIFEKIAGLGIEFVPYNFYAGWAKQVFVKRCHKDLDHLEEDIKYPAVYGKGYRPGDEIALTKDDPRYVHLVFVGTTNFAVAFAMEAAHVFHFPNGEKVKTLITFIDKNADKEKDEFIIRNRHFFEVQPYYYYDLTSNKKDKLEPDGIRTDFVKFNGKDAGFLDVEFEFIKGDVFSKMVQDKISKWADDTKGQYLSIFLALSEQRQNFVFSMNMPDSVYDNEIPVFIRQDRSDNFVSNLRKADEAIRDNPKKNTYYHIENGELKTKVAGGRYANIFPFGMNETAYSADEKSMERAKLINYLYCTMPSSNKFQGILALNTQSKEQIFAEADGYWRNLSVAHKWSNLYSAYTIRIKLASLRSMRGLLLDDTSRDTWPLSDDEVEMMARIEHNRWNVEKLLMGYRKPQRDEDKYAEENLSFKNELKRNKDRFIHHDIRTFVQLDGIKDLDYEFSRYIPWIMKMTEE